MPRKSHAQLAVEHGVDVELIAKAGRAGVNIQNIPAMQKFLKFEKDAEPPPTIPDEINLDDSADIIEQLKSLALRSPDLATVKTIREKAEAIKKLKEAEIAEGLVISIKEIEERETKIGNAVKAAFDKLGYELPGACAGLDEVGITEIYEKKKLEILTMLADITSQFWKERGMKK